MNEPKFHNPDNLETAGDPPWRFLVEGESIHEGCEIRTFGGAWKSTQVRNQQPLSCLTYRTRRPLPAPQPTDEQLEQYAESMRGYVRADGDGKEELSTAPQPGGGGEAAAPMPFAAMYAVSGDLSVPPTAPIALVRAEGTCPHEISSMKTGALSCFECGMDWIDAQAEKINRLLRELEEAKAMLVQSQIDLLAERNAGELINRKLAALNSPRSETEGRDKALVDWIASHPIDAIELIQKNTWSLATAPKSAYINTKDMKHTCGIREAFAALAHEPEAGK